MITVDQFLLDIDIHTIHNWPKYFPERDRRILSSLTKQLSCGHYFTENQGKLLVKILEENKANLKETWPTIETVLADIRWSKPFRVLEQIRKIFLVKDNTSHFFVEFTYNKRLKLLLTELSKKLQGIIPPVTNKIHSIPFTEKNIYLILSALKNQRFQIDQNLMEFYQEIDKIIKNKESLINEEYNFFIANKNIISQEIDLIEDNSLLVKDRSIRYQYHINLPKNDDNLAGKIASRGNNKIWINNKNYTIYNILESLNILKRFPLLVIADGHDSRQTLENTKILHEIVGKQDLSVYFRYDNKTEQNQEFNTYVGESKHSHWLNQQTKIVMLALNKLPKFVLKSSWYPRSVLSFTNSFSNTKTNVWCNAVDLIIFHTDKQPIMGTNDAIL